MVRECENSTNETNNRNCKDKVIKNKILIISNICSFIVGYLLHFSLHHD